MLQVLARSSWTKQDALRKWVTLTDGCHVLRSNVRDWTPIPHLVRFGYEIQSVTWLLAARDLLEYEQQIVPTAVGMADGRFSIAAIMSPACKLAEPNISPQ